MAISLHMPSKKFWLLILGVLVVAVAVLWRLGKDNESALLAKKLAAIKSSQEAMAYYNQIIDRTKEIRSLAGGSLVNNKPLETILTNPVDKAFYEPSDLKTSKKEDAASLKAYGESLGAALAAYSAPRENEAKTMLKALDAKNSDLLSPIKNSITVHNAVLAKLAKLTPPKSALSLQINLMNNIKLQSQLLTNMLEVFSQPLLALESAQAEHQATLNFYQLASDINLYFRSRGVVFSPTETVNLYSTN